MSPGPLQILIIVLVIALVIGPSRIARMARSLGRGAYDFIDELSSGKKDRDDEPPGELEPGDEMKEKQEEDRRK